MRCKNIEIISLTIERLYRTKSYGNIGSGKRRNWLIKTEFVILKSRIAEPGTRVGYRQFALAQCCLNSMIVDNKNGPEPFIINTELQIRDIKLIFACFPKNSRIVKYSNVRYYD